MENVAEKMMISYLIEQLKMRIADLEIQVKELKEEIKDLKK